MNKTKIEWTDYTWNPVVGCKNGCWYCYAKRMNNRFKWIEKWDEPKFFSNRWNPYILKKPSKIFVCSMADLFGDWISASIIHSVIDVAKNHAEHTFQFLTKNPKRYLEFDFPKNCWLGLTLTGSEKEEETANKFAAMVLKDNHTFISFEPLLGKNIINQSVLENHIDLIIVGAMTGPGAIKPKNEWIDSIKHRNIFYKNNIKKYARPNS